EVTCQYLYLTSDQNERYPPQDDFTPGEFTQLFQKYLETIDLIFNYGIDWQAFLIALQTMQLKLESSELSIQALENKNKGSLIIRLNVPPEISKIKLKNELIQEYKAQLKIIDNQYRYQLQANYEEIATARQQSAEISEIMQVMADRAINLDSISNQSNLECLKSKPEPTKLPNDYSPQQKQSLINTATKIHKLLQQLDQTYPTTTPLEKQKVVIEVIKRIEKNPILKAWVIGVMKEVSTEALKELINHPLVNVLLAALAEYKDVDE
ncbi:MAG: pentapeptide repeat-containing protein, partial [Coleofasciculaceae cyanobacterium]